MLKIEYYKCILFLEHTPSVKCNYFPLQLVWLNITAATWDKVPANSGLYMRRNSSNLLGRKYVRCVRMLPKWGQVIKYLGLLWLLYIHLCLRGFHLPWDRCSSCWTALFTGSPEHPSPPNPCSIWQEKMEKIAGFCWRLLLEILITVLRVRKYNLCSQTG